MKRLLLLLLILPTITKAQYFTGGITYKINIIPKSDTVDVQTIMDLKNGVIASYVITAKKYKSTYFKEGEYNYSYTYNDESKRMYDDYVDRPYLTFRDSRKANIENHKSKIFKDSTLTILGFDCYMVISESEYGLSKTYYAENIKVDYSQFEGHKVGNWYEKLKAVDGAMSLKTITEYENYFEIREAIQVEERKVKNKEFKLPKKPIAASYTALDKMVEMEQPTKDQIECYQMKVIEASNPEGEKHKIFVSFLLHKNGEINYIEPIEKDKEGLYKVAIEVVKNCNFQFKPGEINGEPIDSQVYFNVDFLK